MTTHVFTSTDPYRRSMLRQQRSRDTRSALLRAAARLWAADADAFGSTTVAQICAAAGVGRTTFYLHFESKDDLLGQLAWATASGVAAEVEAAGPDVDDQLEVFVEGLARRMEAGPKALAALVIGRAASRNAAARPGDGDLASFDDILVEVLADGQRRGEIVGTADTAEFGAILAGMTMDAIARWATGRSGSRPLRDALHLRVRLIVDPIRTGH